jgi:hypothetical protein
VPCARLLIASSVQHRRLLLAAPEHPQTPRRGGPESRHEGAPVAVPQQKPKRPEPQRHQWFNAWLTARGGGLKALVGATVAILDNREKHTRARTRARKPLDQVHHLKRVEAVVCNLANAVLMPPPTGRIAVKLGNGRQGRSRYDSPVLGKKLSPLIHMLSDLDILDLNWSTLRGEVSSVAPSAWFVGKVSEYGIRLSDFGRDEAEEVVVLTRNTREVLPWWSQQGTRKLSRERIDYTDTQETHTYRKAVRHLNAFLSAADIDFLDDGLKPRTNPFERTLRRHFLILPDQDEGFDQGGRLFGGFWETLKSERRRHIRIDGEPVADLDYGAMFTRLAYAEVGATPPEGDLYAIPGLEGYRSGVKLAMNTFLFDEGGSRRSWPSVMGVGVGDDHKASADPTSVAASLDARLPKGYGVTRTKTAILQAHPALKAAWGRRLGYRLMFIESQILISVLLDLASHGIPALPIHDGLMVAQSMKDAAKEVMTQQARLMTGIAIPVTEKGLGLDG